MLKHTVVGLFVALACTGALSADEIRGRITKVEDGAVTIRTIVVRPDENKGAVGEARDKTFKIDKDIKIVRVPGPRKDDIPMTLDELKTAVKAGKVTVAITHEGENCSTIKVLPPGLGG